ncbi:hypothetical protein MA16_Dca017647 [Dendrobium catenatum]|uniref:Uncharacterized protein n=1 Tax=Dendrobium catenatum TaxID=906689 RepID=A0A2I0VMR1_9ASPA|nr:hypothetical protein MA16_Dca017647 [Dendrobium catenatum]
MKIIVNRGWETLCEEPNAYVVNIVMDFFSNTKEAQNNKYFILSKWAPFNPSSINRDYKIRDVEFDE